jgi:N-acetylglucosamine malate deacetylase 2
MGHLQWSINAKDCLAASLRAAELAPLLDRTLVIVAHPDDETIMCGGLLQRMQDPCVVFATDGAPEDPYFWGRFDSRDRYAAIREEEANSALAAVGVDQLEFLSKESEAPLIDQLLYRSLPVAFAALSRIVERRQPGCLLTLAYEGGHPDHDSVSFLSAQLGRTFRLPVWEAPLYHRNSEGGGVYQRFVDEDTEVIEHAVKGEELQAKQRMLSCYKSQFDSLPSFNIELERFRPQASYAYSRRPHAGKANYELWQWPMTAEDVSGAFVAFSSTVATSLK